jgi:TRAP-type C4-dicarboxylate transport system permease small subunit
MNKQTAMDYFVKIVYRSSGIGAAIGALFLFVVMLIMVANIIFRFFGGVIAGTYEMVALFIVATISFSLAYTAMSHGHVVMDVLGNRLPPRVRAIIDCFDSSVSLGLWILIAWTSVWLLSEKLGKDEVTDLLNIPFAPFRFLWEIGLILLCLVLLIDLIKAITTATRKGVSE